MSIFTRFYIYDKIITQSHTIAKHRRLGQSAFVESSKLDHVKTDMKGGQLILEALEQHPLRTMDPDEADVFVVPTPITEILAYGCQWEDCEWFDNANHPIFKRTQGHNHVIVALSWPSFNKRYSAFFPALSRSNSLLRNVTVAHNYDPFGCVKLHERVQKRNVR